MSIELDKKSLPVEQTSVPENADKSQIKGAKTDTVSAIAGAKSEMLQEEISAGQIMESGVKNPEVYKKYLNKISDTEYEINFGGNRSAERRLGLSELMDETAEGIRVTKTNGRILEGRRQGIKGAFYTAEGKYIPVVTGDKVKIEKARSPEELQTIQKQNDAIARRLETLNPDIMEFKNKYSEEYDLIIKKSLEFGIDPTLVMALRKTENGGLGKQFGVLKDDLNTFASQLIMSCRIIQNNMNRFKSVTGLEPRDGAGNFTSDFLCFFSNIYSPIGASNDPTNLNQNHLRNILTNYSKLSGNYMGDIEVIVTDSKSKIEGWNTKMYAIENRTSGSTKELLALLGGTRESVETSLVQMTFFGKPLTVSKYVAPSLKNAEKEIEQDPEASLYTIKDIGGYNWRNARKPGGGESSSLSKHALGIALDINPAENPFYHKGGVNEDKYSRCSIPPRFVEIMKDNGFNWGGDWHATNDSMHFEFSNQEKLVAAIEGGSKK